MVKQIKTEQEILDAHKIIHDKLGVTTKDNFAQMAQTWFLSLWKLWSILVIILVGNIAINTTMLKEIMSKLSTMEKTQIEFKINRSRLPEAQRIKIFREIGETTELVTKETRDYLMQQIGLNRVVSPDSVWIIDGISALAGAAEVVQYRTKYEYKKLSEDGIPADIIDLCEEVDRLTFPAISLKLRHLVDQANRLNKANIEVSYIGKILDENVKSLNTYIKAYWYDTFNDKSALK